MAEQVGALERLEIEAACARLCVDYAYSNDLDRAKVGAQFTEDAVMHLWGEVYRGAALRDFLASRDPAVQTMHVVTNIRIDVESAESARGTAYVQAIAGMSEGGALARAGRIIRGVYHDRYRKTGGRWLIAERRFQEVFQQESKS